MTNPTVYAPSAYPSVPRAPQGSDYPGFAPTPTPTPTGAPAPQAPMNVMALVAFISSFLGFGIISIVLGFIGLSQIKAKGERGRGFGIAGVAIGGAAVVGVVVLCVALVVLYQIGVAAGY